MLYDKFCWNWPSDSWEDENKKVNNDNDKQQTSFYEKGSLEQVS